MNKEKRISEDELDSSRKSDGVRNTSHSSLSGTEGYSESSCNREERDHRSSNKTEKKKVAPMSPRNSPPELIHYLKDRHSRHGPKRKDDSSPPQLLPEVIVTRTKLNREKPPIPDLLPYIRKGKWDGGTSSEISPTEVKVSPEAIKSSPKSKRKIASKSSTSTSEENVPIETPKPSVQISLGEVNDRSESVVEIQRRLILDLQEKQKKLRQQEKNRKVCDRLVVPPKYLVPATENIETSVGNGERGKSITSKNSSIEDDNVASKTENDIGHDMEESLESFGHDSSDIQDESPFVDYEDWITEEEVEDVDDELFVMPQHVSTGKEERDVIDGIEFLSFETEHDMVEFTKIELDFKGVTLQDDLIAQSDDGLDMIDDSFAFSESDASSAAQAIVPTKTKDITKIKGWRTKQFAVNENPMDAHCSSSNNGLCEDDDGFGSCDVKLEEELSLDVMEDHSDKWDADEQESLKTREKLPVEKDNKIVNEEIIDHPGVALSTEKKSDPSKNDEPYSNVLIQSDNMKQMEENAKSDVEVPTEDDKRPKTLKTPHSPVDSQTRLSVRILQNPGRKPKTLAEKRMMMELEQKRKDMQKQKKRVKRRRGRPKGSTNKNKFKSVEESCPRVYEFRKRLKNSFVDSDLDDLSDGDEPTPKETRSSVKEDLKEEEPRRRNKYVLDKNYCYYWHEGKPIRLAGSHKNGDEERKPSDNEDTNSCTTRRPSVSEDKNLCATGRPSVSEDKNLCAASISGLGDDSCDITEAKVEKPPEVPTSSEPAAANSSPGGTFEYSLIVNPTVGSPLVPLAVSQLELLRSNSQYIDENWAKFAASVVVSRDWRKNPLPRNRIVLPMRIPNIRKAEVLDVSHSKLQSPLPQLPSGFQRAPTGLRLIRPMPPPATGGNISQAKFGPMGPSIVRIRAPKPPTMKGIRTLPGSVRLNPIVSTPSAVTNSKQMEKQKPNKKESQLPGKRGKTKISNWKAKVNPHIFSIDECNIDSEVKNVVQGMVSYVALREVCDSFIRDDPDISEPHLLDSQVPLPRGKHKRKKALFRELSKLDVTVIDMDMHENAGEGKGSSSKDVCCKEYCKLGCVCGSLQVCKSLFPQHCGHEQCMFGCKCNVPNTTSQDKNNDHVLSEEAILNLQNKNSRYLAKEEKEFRHTVIRAKDEMIIVGGDGTARRKREIKLPGRYRDSYMTLGVGLGELKLSLEDVEQPRRSGRSLNTVEYITSSSSKRLLEKTVTACKDPCNVKECQVKLEKLDLREGCVNPLCMEHSAYACSCIKSNENYLKADGSDGVTSDDNSIPTFLKAKPRLLQVASHLQQETGAGTSEVKSEVEPSSSEAEEACELISQEHSGLPCVTEFKSSYFIKEENVHSSNKEKADLYLQKASQSFSPESKTSAFIKLLPKRSSSPVHDVFNDLPLLKPRSTKSRNVAVKSTTRPPIACGGGHDIFQHSARTALPSINYRLRYLSQTFIRQNSGQHETLQSPPVTAEKDLNATSFSSDTVSSMLAKFSDYSTNEIKQEALSPPEIAHGDSSEVIGRIESVTSLSVEEFHRVESAVDIEEEATALKKKHKDPPKQFKVEPNLLQCVGSINAKENVRNLTVDELEVLLQKTESRHEKHPVGYRMDSEKSVHLLHFPLVKKLFSVGQIQLWFSKCTGNGSKLIMTALKEKPGQSYINLNDIPTSEYETLPDLIMDILRKPVQHSDSSDDDCNQNNTYVLLRFDGKNVELGKAIGENNSHLQGSENLDTGNVEYQNNIDGIAISKKFLNEERLASDGQCIKSGEGDTSEPVNDSELALIMPGKEKCVSESITDGKRQSVSSICTKSLVSSEKPPRPTEDSLISISQKTGESVLTDSCFKTSTRKQESPSENLKVNQTLPEDIASVFKGCDKEENRGALEEATHSEKPKAPKSQEISTVNNEEQTVRKLTSTVEQAVPLPLEAEERDEGNYHTSLSRLKQLQTLARMKTAIVSKLKKLPEKDIRLNDVQEKDATGEETASFDRTVKIPLPTCNGSRWYVLNTERKFDVMFSTSRQCSVKLEQILEAINISQNQKGTVCLPFVKNSNNGSTTASNKPKFGIYAVSGITSKVFIGPYGLSEESCLIFYKKLPTGGYVNTDRMEELGKDCIEKDTGNDSQNEALSDRLKRVSCKDVWLYAPAEKVGPKSVEDGTIKLKNTTDDYAMLRVDEEDENITTMSSAMETTAKIGCKLGESDLSTLLPESEQTEKKVEKWRKVSDDKGLLKRENHGSDAEDLDVETVSEETSAEKLIRTEVSYEESKCEKSCEVKPQNIILLSPERETVEPKIKLRPILPAPPSNQDSIDSSLPVKLIPSVPSVGFISATYYVDGRVIFRHPVERVKMSFSSMLVANQWLHKFFQSRIRYIPKQLRVTWKPVSMANECEGLEPFKTEILNGNYILTVRGLLNLKEVSPSEAKKFGLRYMDVIRLQEKRNRRDLLDGFNKLRTILFEGPLTSKVELLVKARENIMCLRDTGKTLEKKKKALQHTKNSIFQRLGSLMKEMSANDKKDTLQNIKKVLQELNSRPTVPVVELDGDSDSEKPVKPQEAFFSCRPSNHIVIDLSGNQSDLEEYMSDDSCLSEVERNISCENITYVEKKQNGTEIKKLNDSKSDDLSISISVVNDVNETKDQKKDVTNDDVTVTCIPVKSSSVDTMKSENVCSYSNISISREKLCLPSTSWNSITRDRRSSDVDVDHSESEVSHALKRKRSSSVDDDISIFHSDKKSCSVEKVSGKLIQRNTTIWPPSKCKTVVVGNCNSETVVPAVKKEPLNIEVVSIASPANKPQVIYPRGINIFNNNPAKRMSNFKIVSGKIESNSSKVGDQTVSPQVSKINGETVNMPAQSPLFMRLVKSPVHGCTEADRGFNLVKVGNPPVKSPVKLTVHSKLPPDDGKIVTSSIATHPKTSLKYVYNSSGGKMYVNGPSGPLPLVVATRTPSLTQDDSKRTMTLTVSKPKFLPTVPNLVQVPKSTIVPVNSDTNATLDVLKIPVKRPVSHAQLLDVPGSSGKKDISHSESLMKWVSNCESTELSAKRTSDNKVQVVTDR